MADLDSLIGSKISLISLQDIRYDGTLFSINQIESSLALKDVQVFGTEDRVTDPAKKVAANTATIPFVTFPGSEIKDLYVHETFNDETPAPAPPAAATSAPKADNRSRSRHESKPAVVPPQPPSVREERPRNDQNRGPRRDQQQQQQQQQQPRSVVGTGSHLLKLRERKVSGNHDSVINATTQDFDFEEGNKIFNKEEVVEEQAADVTAAGQKKYLKDDFFDNLSNDVTEKEVGRKTRLTASEERQLNTDTFGAIALQNNYRRGGRGRGGRGGNNGGNGRGYGNNGGYNRGRGGHGQGRGGGRQNA